MFVQKSRRMTILELEVRDFDNYKYVLEETHDSTERIIQQNAFCPRINNPSKRNSSFLAS